MHVNKIWSNIKGGVDTELGEKTLIVGANGRGKSAIVNAVELALGGSASDIVGRSEVKRESDLLALSDDDFVEAVATLSDGQAASWKAERKTTGGAKKAARHCPVIAAFPVREVRAALGGSADTARSWLLSKVVSDVSRSDVASWFTPEVAELYASLAGPEGDNEISALLRVLQEAGKDARSNKRQLATEREVLERLGRDLGAEPTTADLKAAQEAAADALEDYEVAMRASGREEALEGVEKMHGHAARLIEMYGLKTADWDEVRGLQPPGPELAEDEMRMSDRLHILIEASRLHEQAGASRCLLCESPGPFNHASLIRRKEAVNAQLEHRDEWWSTYHRVEAEMLQAQDAAEESIRAFQAAKADAEAIQESGASLSEAKALWEGKHMAQAGLEAATSQWSNLRGQKDSIRQLKADVVNLEELVESGKQAVNRLLKTAVTRFEESTQSHLPETDVFRLVLEEAGKEVCRFGFERDGVLHTALSGAEWARLTLALACAVCDGSEALVVFTPEERAYDPTTLREVMAALSNAPGQVLLTSPIRHKGRLPKGWTVVEVDGPSADQIPDSTQTESAASPS